MFLFGHCTFIIKWLKLTFCYYQSWMIWKNLGKRFDLFVQFHDKDNSDIIYYHRAKFILKFSVCILCHALICFSKLGGITKTL